jgi:hypothetical protein
MLDVQSALAAGRPSDRRPGGHLYLQTNEARNAVIHYRRSPDGTLTEVERIRTGGSGSAGFKPISGQASAPNDFEGAGSVILTPDRRFLFATNGGDNSVSSLGVDGEGCLTLLDVKPTGNPVTGRSGTAKSLAYAPSSATLFVLHAFGPDHVRLMSVDGEGRLTVRLERYSVNTPDKDDRVATMATLSPDQRFLFVGTTFDQCPTANPDGSAILWVPGRTAVSSRSPRTSRTPTASSPFPSASTERSAPVRSTTVAAAPRSTSRSCTGVRTPSSWARPSATGSSWAASTGTATSASARW